MPEIQSKGAGLGGLGSLAGLAGIDIGGMAGSVDAIRPDIYPDVLQSVPFALQLLASLFIRNCWRKKPRCKPF